MKIFIMIITFVLIGYFLCKDILFSESFEKDKIDAYVSMTTIPGRICTDWFYENLKHTLSILPEKTKLILNVPDYSLKKEKYAIPEKVVDLESDVFEIHSCRKDEGPITKLLPTLRNDTIDDNAIVMIIDDDIVYRKKLFHLLKKSVQKHQKKISSMCTGDVEGFKGYGFVKKVLKNLSDKNIPTDCTRIDDFVVQKYVKYYGIPIKIVKYNFWARKSPYCCIKDHENHPDWDELNFDDREPMNENCDRVFEPFGISECFSNDNI